MAKTPPSNHVNQNRPPVPPRVAKAPLSKESKFIGYLVLGFGFLAVVTVLILVFSGGDKKTAPAETVKEVQALAPELIPDAPQAAPVERKELYFTRDPNFDASKMNGEWQTSIGQYTAVLQIDKNIFQIILADPNPEMPRLYSSGNFKVFEDMIVFDPQLNWPEPKSGSKDILYSKLTLAPYPVIATYDGDEMLWQNPPQDEQRVVVPYRSPLVMSEEQDLIIWKRLK